jgi:predicted nucleic-acid-binding protein
VKKTPLILPDTNIIVRYLLNDDIEQSPLTETFFKKVLNGETQILILESVVAECIYVLTKIYRVPREEAAGRLADLLRYKGVQNPDRSDLISALTLFSRKDIDIVDCFLVIKTSHAGWELFSFDKELKQCTINYIADSFKVT